MRSLVKKIILLISLPIIACSGENSQRKAEINEEKALPLPSVPVSLTTPEARAAWMVEHFWDALDMNRPEQTTDTALMEQTFANFLGMLPYVTEIEAAGGVETMVKRCTADAPTVRLIEELAEKYLDDPNSPMRQEEMYMLFLRSFINVSGVPLEVAERSRAALARAMKNRPGDIAADFRVVTAEGTHTTLHHLVGSDTTIVMFYDHDCDQCREITRHLSSEEMVLPYRITAIDITGNRTKWEETRGAMPAGWQVAFATDDVEESELYVFPAMPALYLIAPGGRVILKDFPVR